MNEDIPASLRGLFAHQHDSDALLARLVEVFAVAVGADRCLLFLYEPERRLSRCTHAWQAWPEWTLPRSDDGWQPMRADLATQDPLFAQALADPEALFIDDIDSADPVLVNAPYEREHFGHRALLHAPLLEDGALYGILEACTMMAPRCWSARDRAITAWTQAMLLPVAKRYVATHCRQP